MIVVDGYVRLKKASDVEKIRPFAEAQIAASRAEAGCLDYGYAVDFLDPCLIRVSEKWESWAALEAHFKMPHMAVWRGHLADIDIEGRVISAHEVKDTRPL